MCVSIRVQLSMTVTRDVSVVAVNVLKTQIFPTVFFLIRPDATAQALGANADFGFVVFSHLSSSPL